MRLAILLALCLVGWGTVSAATIYSYIDENGQRVFTDTPPDSRTPIEIQTIEPPLPKPVFHPAPMPLPVKKAPAKTERAKPKIRHIKVHYRSLRIIHPEADVSLPLQQVSVTIDNEPALLPDHRYRLILDGKPLEPVSESPLMLLDNLKPGTHWLAVEILDLKGRVIEGTPSQPLHLHDPAACQGSDCSHRTASTL